MLSGMFGFGYWIKKTKLDETTKQKTASKEHDETSRFVARNGRKKNGEK